MKRAAHGPVGKTKYFNRNNSISFSLCYAGRRLVANDKGVILLLFKFAYKALT